jgi:hypothetical protein
MNPKYDEAWDEGFDAGYAAAWADCLFEHGMEDCPCNECEELED